MARYGWAIFTAFLMVFVNSSPTFQKANFFIKILGFLVSTASAYYGLKLGKIIRDFIMPDYIITHGGISSIIKAKIFWSVGIQAIGCFAGADIGAVILFKIAGPSVQQIQQQEVADAQAKNEAYAEKWKQDHAAELSYHNVMMGAQELTDHADFLQEKCRLFPTDKNGYCVQYNDVVEKIRLKGVCREPKSAPDYNRHWVPCESS